MKRTTLHSLCMGLSSPLTVLVFMLLTSPPSLVLLAVRMVAGLCGSSAGDLGSSLDWIPSPVWTVVQLHVSHAADYSTPDAVV